MGSISPRLRMRSKIERRSLPCTYSSAMKKLSSTLPRSKIWAMFACWSCTAIFASSMNIVMNSSSSAMLGRMRFTASNRSNPSTPKVLALKTSAMPPTFIRSRRTYLPNGCGFFNAVILRGISGGCSIISGGFRRPRLGPLFCVQECEGGADGGDRRCDEQREWDEIEHSRAHCKSDRLRGVAQEVRPFRTEARVPSRKWVVERVVREKQTSERDTDETADAGDRGQRESDDQRDPVEHQLEQAVYDRTAHRRQQRRGRRDAALLALDLFGQEVDEHRQQ